MIEDAMEPFEHIEELRKSKGRVAIATLVNTHGTTPRKEGAKMVVGERGDIVGSVTIGGCVDAQVIEEAEDVLSTMRPRLLELNLGDEEAWEIGLTCGGTIEVFVEPLAIGAGDDNTTLYERVRAHAARGGRGAVVTRLDGPPAKLVVLDSGEAILKFLREDGVGDADLKRVRVPIGLDLGARSAPEIALAILAEIQAVRGGGSGAGPRGRRRRCGREGVHGRPVDARGRAARAAPDRAAGAHRRQRTGRH